MTYVVRAGLLFIAYYWTARFGLETGALNNFATLLWAPTGISLAALILFGRNLWPAIFLGAFSANLMAGAPLLGSLGIACGNSLEALLGATLCLRAKGFRTSLDRIKDVGVFIFGAGFFATIVSPAVGVLSLWFSSAIDRTRLLETFAHWWAGDIISNLVIAPLILVVFSRPGAYRFFKRYGVPWEQMLLSVLVLGMSELVFKGVWSLKIAPYMGSNSFYILIPFLFWGAIRFGQFGAALVTFIVSAIAVWNAASGTGVFDGVSGATSLFQLGIFVIVTALTGLILGAVISERENERLALEQSRQSLQIITDKLMLREIELERARDAAEAASAAKTSFLANMSHELRTPLGAVLGLSEFLLNPNLDPEVKSKGVEAIRRNGKLLSNIIDDVLDLSKVEAGRMEFEKSEVSLEEVVVDLTSLLYVEAARKGLEMKIYTEGPIPAMITTDPLRLRQILLNVVGNAIKFTDAGHIHVKIKLGKGLNDQDLLFFVVEDTGCGISVADRAKLFAPFSQSDVSTTRKYGGTGLGLALARQFAQALGGNLNLTKSSIEEGSTFIISIDPGEVQRDELSSSLLGQRMELNQQSYDFKSEVAGQLPKPLALEGRLSILLVDDSQDNQFLIKQLLLKAGVFRVEIATNGIEALRFAAAEIYDLILMDIQMPEMDGTMAARILRESGNETPIIALTANAMVEDKHKIEGGDFTDHLCKPVDVNEMIQVIRQAVLRYRRKCASTSSNMLRSNNDLGVH